VLLEGPPNTGKTALAATIAKESDFPFIKIISPDNMVGYTESAKCAMIRKVWMCFACTRTSMQTFDDAYKSPFSVILVDNIERLIDYAAVGPRYSNMVLQALLILLKMQPTNKVRVRAHVHTLCFQKCRLLILCTASNRAVIDDLELAPAFSTVLHVSPLMRGEDVFAVIQSLDNAFADGEVRTLGAKLAGKRYVCLSTLTTVNVCAQVHGWREEIAGHNRSGQADG
jgi:vesicle-fusing ATPase